MRKFLTFLIPFVSFLIKAVLALLLIAATAFAAFLGSTVGHYESRIDLPSQQQLEAISTAGDICGPHGEHDFIRLATVPPLVRDAFLAAEEPDFFQRLPISHPFLELARGARHPPSISLAVARCLLGSAGQKCWQTQLEWSVCYFVLTSRLERTYSREFIFELYLNETWFGRRTWGVSAAANAYFAKSLSDLTPDEAAYIAALPRAPTLISNHPERGIQRRNFVIDQMERVGTLSAAEAAAARERPLQVVSPSSRSP
jgi:membrane peptidoglycan carboxypeptidase